MGKHRVTSTLEAVVGVAWVRDGKVLRGGSFNH